MLLFTAFSISALVSFSIFLWRENEKDIQTVEKFIDYELWEFEEKEELKELPDEQLFKTALEEAPKIPDVYVEFFIVERNIQNHLIYQIENIIF